VVRDEPRVEIHICKFIQASFRLPGHNVHFNLVIRNSVQMEENSDSPNTFHNHGFRETVTKGTKVINFHKTATHIWGS